MTDNWNTRQTLVERAQDPNDQQAWDDFVEHYKPFISLTLRKIGARQQECDDLSQEILITIWKNLKNFELQPRPGSFRSWLSKLIRNKVIDHARSNQTYNQRKEKATRATSIQHELSETEFELAIEKEWERYITRTALSNIRQYFSGTAVQVFEHSLKGLSAKDISEKFELNQDSVRTLKNRVKKRVIKEVKRLRKELEF